MIIWAIIATVLAGGFGYLFIDQIKRTAGYKKQLDEQRRKYLREISDLKAEVKRREHIIHAMEEVNRETAQKKRDIRSSDNPARAATDAMRKLAGGSDRDSSSAGD
ncbi:MAG: hypothetical protein SVR04_00020 [Spirochaetota bacterium]|nr:hypothetical protein [Spirochaetota bacterium]